MQEDGYCPHTGLLNLSTGMKHILSGTSFLQKIIFLEQLLLAATGTALRYCPAAEETAVHNLLRSHGTSGPRGITKSRQQHLVIPLPPTQITSPSRGYSSRCLHKLSLEVFLWKGGFEMFTP